MAVIAQQPQGQLLREESAARRFVQGWLEQHPNVAGGLAIVGELAEYLINGHILVALGRWFVKVTGYIAETALLFAVLWISATSVAPSLVELFMPEQTMKYFVSFALIVLALIPEVILGNATVNVIGHWYGVAQAALRRSWGTMIIAAIWALLFTVPTYMFGWLTYTTIITLANNHGNFVAASTNLVNLRCITGWGYGLLVVVYAGAKKFSNITAPDPTFAMTSIAPTTAIDYEELAEKVGELLAPQIAQIQANLAAKIPAVDYQKITSTVLANLPQSTQPDYQEIVRRVVPFLPQPAQFDPQEMQQKMEASLQGMQTNLSAEMDKKVAATQANFETKIQQRLAEVQNAQPEISEQKTNENLLWTPSKNAQKSEKIYNQFGQVLAGQSQEKNTEPRLKSISKTRVAQPENSPENEAKNLIGLTYQDAVKMPICQKKNIKVSDIKAAVKSGDLKAKSDGSVARSAVESWARSYQKVAQSA